MLPLAAVDPARFQQVLHNLLANALRHTSAGGHIRIAAGRMADGLLEVAVADSGEGIAAADLPHVFDRFWRGDRARQRGGAGLGLAIARQLVVAQGGTMGVTSVLRQGSRFWYTVRVAADTLGRVQEYTENSAPAS